jgi:hypothetical protein
MKITRKQLIKILQEATTSETNKMNENENSYNESDTDTNAQIASILVSEMFKSKSKTRKMIKNLLPYESNMLDSKFLRMSRGLAAIRGYGNYQDIEVEVGEDLATEFSTNDNVRDWLPTNAQDYIVKNHDKSGNTEYGGYSGGETKSTIIIMMRTLSAENSGPNENIRATIQELIKEIKQENRVEISKTLSEPKQLSEVRRHVRNAINEMMVGLTPITRMNTHKHADNANKGDDTNPAIDKAEIGFNTFDMQEWASIAGITEGTELTEHWEDDGYGSNVIDLLNADSDELAEVPEMWTTDRPAVDSGDLDDDDVVGDTELGFEKFMQGMGHHEHSCGCDQCEEKHGGDHEDEDEFSFTGDVGELPGDDAFAIGLEAGKRGLDDRHG